MPDPEVYPAAPIVSSARCSIESPHDFPGGWVDQTYLPLDMEPPGWYQPKEIGYEREIQRQIAARRKPDRK